MTEGQSEVQQPPQSTEKKTDATQVKTESPESRKSFFQEIKEKATKAWNGFKEGIGRLLEKTDEKLVKPLTTKATEIAEKTKIERVKEYFKTQAENFRDEIRIGSNEVTADMYDFLAVTNDARAMFWRKFMGGRLAGWAAENQEKAKERRDYAKHIRAKSEKIKETARRNRDEAKSLYKTSADIREKSVKV